MKTIDPAAVTTASDMITSVTTQVVDFFYEVAYVVLSAYAAIQAMFH